MSSKCHSFILFAFTFYSNVISRHARNDVNSARIKCVSYHIKKLQHKSHTHAHTRSYLGCCIKNNIVVWPTKIRKFIQRIAWCYGHRRAKSLTSSDSWAAAFPPTPSCPPTQHPAPTPGSFATTRTRPKLTTAQPNTHTHTHTFYDQLKSKASPSSSSSSSSL